MSAGGIIKESKTAKAAMSIYEKMLFKKILEAKAVEKAQKLGANDGHLSDQFSQIH